MGLTSHSTGMKSVDSGLNVKSRIQRTTVVAIAGNPNVGERCFNNLTGMRQHTGNWPGKTVANARGAEQRIIPMLWSIYPGPIPCWHILRKKK